MPRPEHRRLPLVYLLSLIGCLVLGLCLLIVCSPVPIHDRTSLKGFARDLGHDLGIALCVSFVVAGLFEVYRSVRHQMESMRDVIDFVMGDQITPEVWLELKELIDAKSVIRRDVRLRLEVERHPALLPHEAILKVEHQYDLSPLLNKHSKYTIRHELDYQFENRNLKLPCWDSAVIDPETARTKKDKVDLSADCLSVEVSLPPRRHQESVFVQLRRRELMHLPGSYNLYVPEFMKGLHLNVVGCPPEFRVEVIVRPEGGGRSLPNDDDTWSCDRLIFPGQGIEVKFIQVDSPSPNRDEITSQSSKKSVLARIIERCRVQ
jgi:hypothetical protein